MDVTRLRPTWRGRRGQDNQILFPRQIEFFLREVLCALGVSIWKKLKTEDSKTEEVRFQMAAFKRCSEHGAGRSMDGLGQDVPATMEKMLLIGDHLSHPLPAELLAQGLVKRPPLETQ